jgi:hypothetical protein
MLRISGLRLISEKWAVCSAQIQSLIVDGQNDPSGKLLQSARGFLRDVDLERVVKEADDALELLYFMQRVDYPKGSKLEMNASEWLQRNSDTFDIPQLQLMCQYAIEKEQRVTTTTSSLATASSNAVQSTSVPQLLGVRRPPHIFAVELWHRTIIQRSWFRARTQEWISKLDLGALLTFAKVASWSWDAAASQSLRTKSDDSQSTAEDNVPTNSMSWNDRNDTVFLKKALLERGAALLLDTVSTTTTTTTRSVIKPSAVPLTPTTIAELTQYVLPGTLEDLQVYGQTFAQTQLFACLDAHLLRLSKKDAVRLVTAIASMPSLREHGYSATRIVLSLVRTFEATISTATEDGRLASSDSAVSLLASGTLLGVAALKVLQSADRGARSASAATDNLATEHPPLLRGITSLCSAMSCTFCLPESLDESSLTPEDQEQLIAFSTLIAGIQSINGDTTLSKTLQSTCVELGASLPLQLMIASSLFDSETVDDVWVKWCRKSVVGDKVQAVTPSSAKCAIRALATIFLGDDSSVMGRESSPFSWLQPGSIALQHSILMIHFCTQQILDARHTFPPSVADLCSIMFVQSALEEKQTIAHDGASLSSGSHHKSHQKALTEQLIQRIAHSSKFSTVAAISSWQWNFDMTRMVVHSVAAAECGHMLQSYTNIMDQLHRVVQQELSDVQRDVQNRGRRTIDHGVASPSRAGGRTVGACAGLLIALSDAQFSKTQLARNVLQMIVLMAPQATAAELARCLTILPIVNMRDIHAACTFMRELRDRDPLSHACVVEAGDAARRLRMTQHFQQCRVSERVTSLLIQAPPSNHSNPSEMVTKYLSLEMFSVLICACTIDEQRRFFLLAQSTAVPDPSDIGSVHVDTKKKSTPSKRKSASSASTTVMSAATTRSIASEYLAGLPSFLASRPSTALMMLACPECPLPFLHCISDFLKAAKPLSPDDADSSAFLAAVSSVDEMIAKQIPKAAVSTPSSGSRDISSNTGGSTSYDKNFLDNLFTELTVFGTEVVLQLDESSLMHVIAASGRVGTLPNRYFRVMGRRITPLADTMTAENALSCLELYAKYNIRDDRVVKALLSRCIFTMGMIGGSVDLSSRLRRVNATFPHWSQGAHQALQKYSAFKARRERRME